MSPEDLRDVINNCQGYRILEDEETIQPGDQTICSSVITWDDWTDVDDFWIGQTVEQSTSDECRDMDASERLFRRGTKEIK